MIYIVITSALAILIALAPSSAAADFDCGNETFEGEIHTPLEKTLCDSTEFMYQQWETRDDEQGDLIDQIMALQDALAARDAAIARAAAQKNRAVTEAVSLKKLIRKLRLHR